MRPGTYSEWSSDGLDREPGVAAPHRGGERAWHSAGPRRGARRRVLHSGRCRL